MLPDPYFPTNYWQLMKIIRILFKWFCFAAIFAFAPISLLGQAGTVDLQKQVSELSAKGDYSAIVTLIDQQESDWRARPSTSYFSNMFSIATVVIGETNAEIYWLGRKAIWKALLKPAPNLYGAAQRVRSMKEAMLFAEAENITPLESLSPEMFTAVRHDTFLMLSEYARQARAAFLPGYHNKPVNGADPHTQNAIDNGIQAHARYAIEWLAQDQDNYLIDAYSHAPKDDEELKQLLDILNIRGAERDRIMRDTR
jgi:hypothetical protein